MMRFTDLERFWSDFSSRPLRPSDTHCSTLIGFIGMVFGIEAKLFGATGVFRKPGCQYSDARHLEVLNSVVKRFAKTV